MTQWAQVAENIATVIAIFVGGAWVYLTFVRQRLAYPRVSIELAIQEVWLAPYWLLRVELRLQNSGQVILRSKRADLRLRQIVPVPKETEDLLAKGCDPVPLGRTGIEWPVLAQREWNWAKDEFEVEPGEDDLLCADFAVYEPTRVVELYFFLANPKKGKLGWTLTRHHTLTRRGEEANGI